jgi:hypothetical protein
VRKNERRIRRRERLEQRDEEFRLSEQQGLSPLATSEYSSSGGEEKEESDGGRAPLRGGSLRRRRRSKRLGQERKRPPPGGLRKRRCMPRRYRRALRSYRRVLRRHPGVRQWRLPLRPQHPSSPRGRGSGASPP